MSVRGATSRRHIPRSFWVAGLAAAALLGLARLVTFVAGDDRAVEPAAALFVEETLPALPDPLLEQPDVVYEVQEGDTLADVFAEQNVPYPEIVKLQLESADVFDLTRIQAGKSVSYLFAPEGATYRLAEVAYQPDANRVIRAQQNEAGWIVTEEAIVYDIREVTAAGTVDVSLYVSAMEDGVDEKIILQLADIFAWDIDFARDTRTGDSFRVLFEEKWRKGQRVTSGKILAAEYTNKGKSFRSYYVKHEDGTWGYYAADGKSLQKAFLKAPVNFRYVSSGFSSARFHPVLGKVMVHDGVDYAADYGVPIIAIGDGVVSKMGWMGGYGNRIEVRHNEVYGSQYSHMSAYVKGMRVGDRVTQGQVVGYVGSTGFSTGNHVHFSMTDHGKYVDPATVDAPDGEPLPESMMAAFQAQVAVWSNQLDGVQIPI